MICMAQFTITNVYDGQKGDQGETIDDIIHEYTISTSSTELINPSWANPNVPEWSETPPDKEDIDENHFEWRRLKTVLTDGTIIYSNAVCEVVTSGVISQVNKNTKSITDKVWEDDITTKINQYDGSTVSTIRQRVTQTEQNITGITTRVSDVESETDDLGTRMTSAESSITQNANNINLKVSKDSVISEINQSSESITISADKVNIEGATIFSTGRLSQTSLNNAYDAKGSAATAKTEAINSANSATDTKLQSYSTTSQMNTAIGTAVNNAVDSIEANAIKSTVSCYYRSTSNTTPTITKTTSIGTSNNTDNAWEYVMPVPKRNAYFFTCEKYTYMDDSVAFSTVRPLDSQTYASKWVSSSDNTYVDGGRIYTHSITTSQLATDAIKSNNYQASQVTNSPYSATGTFLDLSTGNFYTPNFGIDNTYGKAYLNGEIIASSGQIGSDTTNYWEIGNKTDYNANDSAAIIGHGSSYIQSGGWMISADRIDTRSYDSNRKYTYPLNNNTYWDFGLHVPNLTSNEVYENNFIYIRNHESTIPTLEGNWNYLFRVDRDGGIEATGLKINGTTIQDMITAGVDGGAYLPTSGGTISGNLTVTGTITGLKTLSVNGKTYNGTVDVNVGVIGAAYGGTGQSSLINSANALINALSTGSSTPTDNDYYVSQYVGGGTTTTTYHRRPMSALWTYIKSKINADTTLMTDKFVPKTGGEFTGAITVSDSFTADEATVGNLIVNGAGRFTNGLYGDLTGNADTATKAAKVVDAGNGHEITLNYSGTNYSSTSWFAAWNGYQIGAISPANVLKTIGADKSASISDRINTTGTGNYNWVSSTNDDKLITSNTLAYWNGAYNSSTHASNLEYVKAGKLGDIVTHNASEFVTTSGNAASATKATQDGDGNTISSTYLKLSGGTVTGITQFNKTIRDANGQHYYGGAANRSQWYKITLAHNGVVPPTSNAQWYMCSMTLHVAGDYQNCPRGAIELCYYIYWDKTAFLADKVFASGYGVNLNKIGIYYTLDDPFVIYVDAYNSYTSLWVDYVSYRDSAMAHNWKETKVETTDAIVVADYSHIPLSTISTFHGNDLYVHSDAFSPAYDNSVDLGGTSYKWKNVYATTFNGDLSGNATSASKLNSTRSFTIGKTAKNVDWSGAVSFSQAEISDNASTSAAGWMSKDDKVKLNGIETGAQVNTITGVKGNSESSYRTGNVNITAANIGLGNLTNNKQVKGLSTGTTSGHFVTWGSDGYTVADSGITAGNVVKSVASNSDGKLVLTYADNTTSDPIDVEFVATETSSVSKAEALNVNGVAIGSATIPVYFDNKGKPQTASTYAGGTAVTLNGTSKSATTASFYAPTGAGTSGQILQSSGGTPNWVNQSTVNTTYTIATGDSNGQIKVTPSSGNAYNVGVKGLGTAAFANTTLFPIVSTYILAAGKAVRIQYPTYVPVLISAQRSNTGGRLILLGGGYGPQGTVRNDFQEVVSSGVDSFTWTLPSSSSISNSIEIMNVRTSEGATITVWSSSAATFTEIDSLSDTAMNKKIITSTNYTDYTVTKTGTGASGTWGINITGSATKANITTVTNSVAKYSDTSGTFADSYITIDSSGNLIIGDNDHPANIKMGAKNDNYGLMPNVNNYGQIGSSSLFWYRAYINNYHGNNSHVNNWDSDKNIGTAATSSASSTLGNVNFYNTCAAGGTQTKTKLQADSTTASNVTITLPKETGTIALTKNYQPYVHYSNSIANNDGKYYKISINSYTSWMLSFNIRLYHSYKAYDLQISGYNYGSNHWHSPSAKILGASVSDSINILFGYDSNYHLWIAIPAQSYTGIDIVNVTNGYTQVDALEGLFTIEMIDSEPTTIQETITAYRPWYRNETVSDATNATNATTATTSVYANNLLAYNSNEVTIGANNSTAGASTNDTVWFNYKDVSTGTISDNATKLVHYYFGNRKGAVTGVQVHADTFVGNLSGNATKDGSGNVITSTYVTLSTAQTISGAKTFSSAVTFANGTWNLMGDDAYIGDCNAAGKIGIKGKNGATGIRLAPYSGSTNQDISTDGSGNLTITGNLKQEGTVTIGSHAKLTYNSTLEALEFSFI